MIKPKRTASPVLRRVKISVCLPVSVTCIARRESGGESDGSWSVDSIERIDCEASARAVSEAMGDVELEDFDKRADAAEDLP